MYRILLVDDELDVLEYFERIIKENLSKKAELDVYSMDSGERALEYFSEYKVDLIISDIQMPGMDGLELYRKIRKKWPKAWFVFLTGHMDFEYVYASAQDANTRFLTKLETTNKIVETVWGVLLEMEQAYREKEILLKARKESELVQPLLQNKVLGQFLYGTGSRSQIEADFAKFGIELDLDEKILLLGASLDIPEETVDTDIVERMSFVLKTLLKSYFQQEYRIYAHMAEMGSNPYMWILQRKGGSLVRGEEILECVQRAFSNSVEYTVSFAYGTAGSDLKDNPRMYRRIQNILGYRDREMPENIIECSIKEGAGSVICADAEVKKHWEQLAYITELDSYMELGMEEKFFKLFEQMVEKLPHIPSMNDTLAQEIYYRIGVLLLRYINMWQLVEKMAFQIEMYKLMRMELHEEWGAAVSFLRKCAKAIFRLYFKEEREGITNYIVFVKAYIKEHLDEDLNLMVLSEVVHLNASYLSRLFRKETGEKLYDYILNRRMHKAKEYILKDTRRIQDIARDVGYESVQSFNRAFKKHTGMSPMDYRNGKERGIEY